MGASHQAWRILVFSNSFIDGFNDLKLPTKPVDKPGEIHVLNRANALQDGGFGLFEQKLSDERFFD